MVNPRNRKRNPSWLAVFRPKDLWPQLHVATPRCSWWDVINSIKDCENPLNAPPPHPPSAAWQLERAMNSQRSLQQHEKPNTVSTAYHFHLSCSGDSVTHALRCVHTPTHIPIMQCHPFYCSCQAGNKPQCNAALGPLSCWWLFRGQGGLFNDVLLHLDIWS